MVDVSRSAAQSFVEARASSRKEGSMGILWIILIVVVVLALLGFFGFRR
jgi:flagellar basal body-associated protein FliL